MGGRGSGSGFSAEREGRAVRAESGLRAERRRILTEIADAVSAERGETGAARMARTGRAVALADMWDETARMIKREPFTDEGRGTWSFDFYMGAGTNIGAQILEEPARPDRPRSFSMVAYTDGDKSERRYYSTRREAERAAKDMMLTRLGDWMRAHEALHERY